MDEKETGKKRNAVLLMGAWLALSLFFTGYQFLTTKPAGSIQIAFYFFMILGVGFLISYLFRPSRIYLAAITMCLIYLARWLVGFSSTFTLISIILLCAFFIWKLDVEGKNPLS